MRDSSKPFFIGNICHEALGMKTGTITNNQIKASSEITAFGHAAACARLYRRISSFPCCFGWAALNSTSTWLEIDFQNKNTVVTGVATQGGRKCMTMQSGGSGTWVTKYKLHYGNDSGSRFVYMESDTKTEKVSELFLCS